MKPITLTLCLLSTIALSLSAPQARIVGGDNAILGQVPYIASLTIGGLPTCGVSILSERWALTLLQCVCSSGSDRPWPPQLFAVTAGSTDLYTGGTRITLEQIIVNPNYKDLITGIALLRLSEPLKFSDYIQPISFAATNPPVDAIVEISGWGRITETATDMHRTLQINEATVTTAFECARSSGRTDNEIICLVSPRQNGICRGDFGGPAVYQNQLIGIAAAVIGECGSMLPDIFTSVASNYDWIMEHMQ